MDAPSLKELLSVLGQQLAAAQALAELLSRERGLLTGTDPQAVQAVAAEKTGLLNRIESLESDRRRVLAIAGRGASGADMAKLCRGPVSPLTPPQLLTQISDCWRTLMAVMDQCREANEVNGAIVGLKQRQVQQLLNVLRTGREDDLTYGPGGRGRQGAARGLARA